MTEKLNSAAKLTAEEIVYHQGIHSGHRQLEIDIASIISKHFSALQTKCEELEQALAVHMEGYENIRQRLCVWETGREIHRFHKADFTLLNNQVEELKQQLSSLQRDKERLDWLEKHAQLSLFDNGIKKFDSFGEGMKTHRAAIDSAIANQTKKEGK